jgi:hypothetical protein
VSVAGLGSGALQATTVCRIIWKGGTPAKAAVSSAVLTAAVIRRGAIDGLVANPLYDCSNH